MSLDGRVSLGGKGNDVMALRDMGAKSDILLVGHLLETP